MKLIDKIIKNNKKIEVYLSNTLIGTPVLSSILECYSEIVKRNLTVPGIPFKNGSSVIWLQNEQKEVLAGICFDLLIERKEGWINLSFTNPPHRGQGYNKICHGYFEKECKNKGMLYIGSLVSVHNEERLKSAKKVGLEPLFYRTVKKL